MTIVVSSASCGDSRGVSQGSDGGDSGGSRSDSGVLGKRGSNAGYM